MRIGHLTDIHVWDDRDLRAADVLTKRATGWVNYRRKRAGEYELRILRACVARLVEEAPDVVVVSGDLSNLGLRSEFEAAHAILQPIEDAGIRLVVVPGNHDYYVASSAEGVFEDVFGAWQVADARGASVYPFVVRGEGVALVCFNSALPLPPFLAAGWIGDAQLAAADTLLRAERAAGRRVVAVVHHHATRAPERKVEWTRHLRDAPAFRELMRRHEVDLVVHGHNHHLHTRRIGTAEGPIIFGLSSSTTNRATPDARRGMVGLYDVRGDGIASLTVARWEPASERLGPFAPIDLGTIPVESSKEALDGPSRDRAAGARFV